MTTVYPCSFHDTNHRPVHSTSVEYYSHLSFIHVDNSSQDYDEITKQLIEARLRLITRNSMDNVFFLDDSTNLINKRKDCKYFFNTIYIFISILLNDIIISIHGNFILTLSILRFVSINLTIQLPCLHIYPLHH